MYLNIQIVINLHRVPEQEDVLHKTGKLPHVPQFGQGLDILRRLHLWLEQDVQLGLLAGALVARHGEGGGALRARKAFEARANICVSAYSMSKVLRVLVVAPKCEMGFVVQCM